jgi:regulator of sigma E protease
MVSSAINTNELKLTVIQKDGDEVIRYLPIATILKYEKEKRVLKSVGIKPYFPPMPVVLGRIIPDKPADFAGLKAGDKILMVNEQKVDYWKQWYQLIQASPNKELRLKVERDGQFLEKRVTPKLTLINNQQSIAIGVYMADHSDLLKPYQKQVKYAPIDAFKVALNQTGDYALLVVNGIRKMFKGELSVMNMGGPVSIATHAGKSANHGWLRFIHFLAIFSVNLGIMNLFPIPVLDGGHLMYLLAEGIKGKPLSEKSMIRIQTFGMMMIASLMMLAFYVDNARLIG